MAVTPSGAISLADINTATGKSATAPSSMNGTAVRCISNTDSGAVSMSSLRNKIVAGGTITSGTKTVTGKGGVINVFNGYSKNSTPLYGTLNNGNITTIPTVTAVETLSGNKASTSTTFSNQFNISATSGTAFTGTIRAKVGNNSNQTLTYTTFIGPAGPAIFNNTSVTPIIAAADVGVSLDWVLTDD